MSVSFVLCPVGSSLCDELISHSEESFLVCVCLCLPNCMRSRNILRPVWADQGKKKRKKER